MGTDQAFDYVINRQYLTFISFYIKYFIRNRSLTLSKSRVCIWFIKRKEKKMVWNCTNMNNFIFTKYVWSENKSGDEI